MREVQIVVFVLFVGSCCCQNPHSYQYLHQKFHFYEDEGTQWLCFILGICSSGFHPGVIAGKPGFGPVFQWSQLEFDYASDSARQADINSGVFVPGVAAPIDVDVHYANNPQQKNRIFVSIPRFQGGIPVTCGVVLDKRVNGNPVIAPYPSWDWHQNPNKCSKQRIVSVYRMQIDECGKLWILDTGRLLEEQVCPPQILAFNLETNELIHRYEIPSNQIEPRSILVTPIVDVRDSKCRDTFVYVADCQTYSIIVYDVKRDTSWKVTDKTMYPYPSYGTFRIAGDHFDLMDGILGMSLEPFHGQNRKLFYHAMSSAKENWVYTSDLRNHSRFEHDPSSSPDIFHTYKGDRRDQSAAEAITKDGIMFFGLMSAITIDCWNIHTEYGLQNMEVVDGNKDTLQFASGVKVIRNKNPDKNAQEEIWILTSKFQKIGAGTLTPSETNFRILAAKAEDLLFGTKCKRAPTGPPSPGGGYGLYTPSRG